MPSVDLHGTIHLRLKLIYVIHTRAAVFLKGGSNFDVPVLDCFDDINLLAILSLEGIPAIKSRHRMANMQLTYVLESLETIGSY
jgi:hypothetical protein